MLTPIGSEFLATTETVNDQINPAIAVLSDNKFVTVWQSEGPTYQEDIRCQLFDNIGNKLGNEILVNTETDSYQTNPIILTLSNDKFVVIWQSYLQDGSEFGIYAQLFDSTANTANKIGSAFQVNTYTTGNQYFPIVKKLTNGNFIVAWSSIYQDSSDLGIYAQIFDDNCDKVGNEILLNTITYGSQDALAITSLNNGNFVTVWRSWIVTDAQIYDIYVQLFDDAGNAIEDPIKINDYSISLQQQPTILTLNNGNFVVIWGDDVNINGQLFDGMAYKIGDKFLVNTSTTGNHSNPIITLLSNGNFVVTWQSEQQNGLYQLRSQIFNEESYKIGNELLITNTDNNQIYPTVTALNGGNFLVAWQNNSGSLSQDVYAQVFDNIGNNVDTIFRVNTHTDFAQEKPLAVTLSNYNILLLWQSYSQDAYDGSNIQTQNYGIYGQIYHPPLITHNLNQTINYTEDTLTSLNSIIVSSAVNNRVTVLLKLSSTSTGSLTTSTIGNTTSIYQTVNGQWQASGPLDEVNALLATTQFMPAKNYNGIVEIDAIIDDGIQSLPGIINMAGIPVTPILTNTLSSLNYTENQVLIIDNGLTITPEADTPLLPKATVSIISNLVPEQDELNFVNQNNITGNYDRQSGRLVLTGLSSTDNYQSALRSVTYTNLSEKPSEQVRKITFTVNDGSVDSPASNYTINVISVNDAPTVINPLPDQLVQTKETFQFAVPINTFVDAENDTLVFKAEAADGRSLPSWLNFDAQNLVFNGIAPTNPGKNNFALWAQDSSNASVKTNFAINVESANSSTAFPWWGILLSVMGGASLLSGTLGLSYKWYHRYRQAEISLAALEMQEAQAQPWVERANKGHTIIHNQYALINKITQEEAEKLKEQEGLEVRFAEGKIKAKFSLGQGEFGKLRLAYDLHKEHYIGVKKIKGEDKIEASQNEGKLQQQLNDQPHIMPLLKSVETLGSENQPVLYQFMPLAGFGNGDTLKTCLASIIEPNFKQKILTHIAKSLLLGLQAMHKKEIYHLDLKPSNFVIDIRGYVYIIDFGCAEQANKEYGHSLLSGGRGDTRYYSPDRIANYCYCLQIEHDNPLNYYDPALADAWALGLTLLEISLDYPFDAAKCIADITTYWTEDYFNRKLNKINELKNPISNSYWGLIKGLLTTDPSKRLTIDQALSLDIFQIDNQEQQFSSDEECQKSFLILKQIVVQASNTCTAESSSQVEEQNGASRKNYATSYTKKSPRSSGFFAPVQLRSDYGNIVSSPAELKNFEKYYSKEKISHYRETAQQAQMNNGGIYGNNKLPELRN